LILIKDHQGIVEISSLLQHRGLAQVAELVTEDMLSLGASSLFANKEYIEEETAKPLCKEIKHKAL
jgi:hypothetical protein